MVLFFLLHDLSISSCGFKTSLLLITNDHKNKEEHAEVKNAVSAT